MKTKSMILCAVFAAILCVFSVITIPIGPVPITLGTFGVMITAVILGPKKGFVSVLVFILLGAVGLPVFSGFKGGFQVLAGVTGGYLWSYIFMALIIGAISAKLPQNNLLGAVKIFLSCVLGIIVCYTLGTVQFMLIKKGGSLYSALAVCVIPFIPFDLAKALIASYAGMTVRKTLAKAKIL